MIVQEWQRGVGQVLKVNFVALPLLSFLLNQCCSVGSCCCMMNDDEPFFFLFFFPEET